MKSEMPRTTKRQGSHRSRPEVASEQDYVSPLLDATWAELVARTREEVRTPGEATNEAPGSKRKLEIMIERLQRGEELHHAEDLQLAPKKPPKRERYRILHAALPDREENDEKPSD